MILIMMVIIMMTRDDVSLSSTMGSPFCATTVYTRYIQINCRSCIRKTTVKK